MLRTEEDSESDLYLACIAEDENEMDKTPRSQINDSCRDCAYVCWARVDAQNNILTPPFNEGSST